MFAQLTKSESGYDLPIVKTGNAARMANGQISASGIQSLDADALKNNYGIVRIETVRPAVGKYQRSVECTSDRELDGNVYRLTYESTDITLQQAQAEALNEIATTRFAVETGGVVVAGKYYSTDRDSQAAIARATGTVNWKCNATVTRKIDGVDTVCFGAAEFVNTDMDAVKAAVTAHIIDAYAREAELMAEIGAVNGVPGLRNIDLTSGWAKIPPSDPGE